MVLALVGCVTPFPKAVHARKVPIYVWRGFPTSSPTSTPSYQPSLRPSSQPTSHPSSSPSTSWPPSHQPSYLTTINPTSTSFTKIESLKVAKPSSFAFWLIISIIGILCCSIVGSLLFLKSTRFQKPKRKEDKQSKKDKDGGWFGISPVAAAGGLLSTFLSSVPSRLEELSVYSESDSDSRSEASLRSLPYHEAPAQDSSGQPQPPCVKDNTKHANLFDFRRKRPVAENDKSIQVSPQSSQGQQPPPSDTTNTSIYGQDTEQMADQVIQEYSEEMSSAMTETWGQTFTRLSALAEETIFPVQADDCMEEVRQRKEHRRSGRHDRNRSGDRYDSCKKRSHHRSDEDVSISITTDSSESSSESDSSSSSSASKDASMSIEYSASSLSEEEYDGSHLGSVFVLPQPVASVDNSVYKSILSSLHRSAVLKPIHVTLTDKSSQHASDGFKNWQSGGSHFSLDIVAEEFEGLTMARRHRLIYMLLGNTMEKIQSLEIKAKSPSEV